MSWHPYALAILALGLLLGLGGLAYLYREKIRERVDVAVESTRNTTTSTKAKALYVSIAIASVAFAIVYISYRFAGLIDTIIYVFLFLFFLSGFPALNAVLGNAAPFSTLIAKLHIILGAFCFGRMVLVQFDDRFELCPATRDRVYINGTAYPIEGGHTNWSILGWRPFGMLRFKDDETLVDVRADVRAERTRDLQSGDFEFVDATADGGTVDRGGYTETKPPAISGDSDRWLIDLKRVFSRGIKRIGDIDLMRKAEEITSRKHAESGSLTSGWEPIIATAVGVILGVATGMVVG